MDATFAARAMRALSLALCCVAFAYGGVGAASAQTSELQTSIQPRVDRTQPVGRKGRLRNVYWSVASDEQLYQMQLLKTARELATTPGAMQRTRVWMARADICGAEGEEILMQIRSPLTCGTLGCEMVVLTEAGGGGPRVLMRTIGNSIDAADLDELTINEGTKLERRWSYARGRFQPMRGQ